MMLEGRGGGGVHRCLDEAHNSKDGGGGDGGSSGSRRQRNRHEAPDISGPRFGRCLYRKDDTRPKIPSTTCMYVRKSTCSTFIMVILGNLGNDVYYTAGARILFSEGSRKFEEYVRNGKKIFLRGFEIKEFGKVG